MGLTAPPLLDLVVISGNGIRAYPLVEPLTLCGSGSDNDIVLDSPDMPAYGLEFRNGTEGMQAIALNRKCMKINGREALQGYIGPGDMVELAGVRMEIRLATPSAKEKHRYENIIETLIQLNARIGKEKMLRPILEAVLQSLLQLTRGSEGFVFTMDTGGKPKVWAASPGKGTQSFAALYSDSVVQEVILSQKPLWVENTFEDSRFSRATSVISLQLTSVICCPVVVAGNLIGVFYVGSSKSTNRFTKNDAETVSLFSNLMGSLLHNAAFISQQNSLLEEFRVSHPEASFIAESPRMLQILDELRLIAPSNLSILLQGETGTGKDLLAVQIHRYSARKDRSFLVVNCATLQGDTLAGELFGYRKGAFTGAIRDYKGLFLSSQGGPFFLDEVAELNLTIQAQLLRVLETYRVKPLGQSHEEVADFRIISATHRNLKNMVRAGAFREDLLFRLDQHTLWVPPLRERTEDIFRLAYHFLEITKAQNPNKTLEDFQPRSLEIMRHYRWNGNVRELKNLVMKSAFLSRVPLVEIQFPEPEAEFLDLEEATRIFQGDYIRKAVAICAGDKDKAAEILKMGRSTLFRRLSEKRESA